MLRTLALTAAFLTLTSSFAQRAAAADFGAKGSVATKTTTLPSGFAGGTGGKLVVPDAPGQYPLVIASHGWSASSANQVGWAEHFASYGLVVVVPDFPSPFTPDAAKNRDIIKTIVSIIATAATAAKDKVDVTKLGLEGHSAGGLATTLAAAALAPDATVLFDPVDRDNLGKTAHATVCSPVLSLFANGSSCNNQAGWFAFRGDVKGPLVSFRVKSSTHCDGENAPRGACGGFCGGAADTGRQVLYARYATAFLLAKLKGDPEAAALLAEAPLNAESGLESVLVKTAPSCADTTTPDGGASDAVVAADTGPATDGATSADVGTGSDDGLDDAADDAATASDSAVPDDAESGAPNATDDVASQSGCGCRTGASGPSAGGVWSLFLLGALTRRSKRRA